MIKRYVRHWPNVSLTLAHSTRRWPGNKTTLGHHSMCRDKHVCLKLYHLNIGVTLVQCLFVILYPLPFQVSIVGSLCDREVGCSASDRQGSNFESCVWMAVSFQSSHHPQEVFLAQFSLYVHKSGLKPDSFHFSSFIEMITLPAK